MHWLKKACKSIRKALKSNIRMECMWCSITIISIVEGNHQMLGEFKDAEGAGNRWGSWHEAVECHLCYQSRRVESRFRFAQGLHIEIVPEARQIRSHSSPRMPQSNRGAGAASLEEHKCGCHRYRYWRLQWISWMVVSLPAALRLPKLACVTSPDAGVLGFLWLLIPDSFTKSQTDDEHQFNLDFCKSNTVESCVVIKITRLLRMLWQKFLSGSWMAAAGESKWH